MLSEARVYPTFTKMKMFWKGISWLWVNPIQLKNSKLQKIQSGAWVYLTLTKMKMFWKGISWLWVNPIQQI